MTLFSILLATALSVSHDSANISKKVCWFDTPKAVTAECYQLRVPESKTQKISTILSLPVVVLTDSETDEKLAPVVLPSIGPLYGLGLGEEHIAKALAGFSSNEFGNRKHIYIDTRGTGLAKPIPNCPEEEAYSTQDRMDFGNCIKEISAGGSDVYEYRAERAADDIVALSEAMKLPRFHVIAYGQETKAIQILARNNPNLIKSAIFLNPEPERYPTLEYTAESWAIAVQRVVQLCRHSTICSQKYQNIFEGDIDKSIDDISLDPLTFEGEPASYFLQNEFNGYDIATHIYLGFENAEMVKHVPVLLSLALAGNGQQYADYVYGLYQEIDWSQYDYGIGEATTSIATYCQDRYWVNDKRQMGKQGPYFLKDIEANALKNYEYYCENVFKKPSHSFAPDAIDDYNFLAVYGDLSAYVSPASYSFFAKPSRGQRIVVKNVNEDLFESECTEKWMTEYMDMIDAGMMPPIKLSPCEPKVIDF
ncbi:alpha/beta fold hydrolase [Corallincola platygyrae]|uniref:Alpha/beta fold hydrolase n=1 Tax=Corallincola platygyrae TaxID=1193278 RepID=A0ABW4XUY7_9GAMM